MLYQPHDVDAPALFLLRLKTKALEGNPHLYLVTVLRQPALGLKHKVRAQVGRLPLHYGVVEAVAAGSPGLDQRPIGLHAKWIYREDGSLAPVVECAEQDLHVVVRGDAVPVGQRGVDRAMRFEGAYAEQNPSRRIPDKHFG
jgi:hypothetical protein